MVSMVKKIFMEISYNQQLLNALTLQLWEIFKLDKQMLLL